MNKPLLLKCTRLVLTMVGFSLLTALVLLGAVPEAGKIAIIAGAATTSLLVGLYDFGLFAEDFDLP
jgi:hypothetical protein